MPIITDIHEAHQAEAVAQVRWLASWCLVVRWLQGRAGCAGLQGDRTPLRCPTCNARAFSVDGRSLPCAAARDTLPALRFRWPQGGRHHPHPCQPSQQLNPCATTKRAQCSAMKCLSPPEQVADIIQIPAFLCRQTDLLVAAAKTG